MKSKHIKFFVSVLAFFYWSTVIIAQPYFTDNYYQGIQQASSQKKFIFLEFSTKQCDTCNLMDKRVFSLDTVRQILTENFICIKIDGDEQRDLIEGYSIKNYPTFIILNSHYRELFRFNGYTNDERLLEKLSIIKFNELAYFQDNWKSKKNDIDFVYDYFTLLREKGKRKKAEFISSRCLRQCDDWSTEQAMEFVLFNSFKRKKYAYYKRHQKDFFEKLGKQKVQRLLYSVYTKEHFQKDYRASHIDMNKIKKDFQKLFGKDYVPFLDDYFSVVLRNKKDKTLSTLHHHSFLNTLVAKPYSLPYTNQNWILELILATKNQNNLKKLESVFTKNLAKDTYLFDWYDLLALIKYKQGKTKKVSEIITQADERYMKKYNKHFRSNLNAYIELDSSTSKSNKK